MYLLRTNKLSKTLRPNASRGDRCKFFHPQGGSPDEDTEDSDEDEDEDEFASARRRSEDNDKDQHDQAGNSGARSSWE